MNGCQSLRSLRSLRSLTSLGKAHFNLRVADRPPARRALHPSHFKKPSGTLALPLLKRSIYPAAVSALGAPSGGFVQTVNCRRAMSNTKTWTCGTCTFDNLSHAPRCAVCDLERAQENVGHSGQSSSAQHVAESGQSEWGCRQCTCLNPDGAARCKVCDYEREKTRGADKGQETEGEKKRKRETTDVNGGSRIAKEAGEDGTKAGDGKRSGQGHGHRTVIELDDADESPQRKSIQKGKEGCTQLDEIAGAGGSGLGSTGASLLHQLHLERLARQAAKQKSGESGDASTSNPGTSSAPTGQFAQKEKLGGITVGGGVRERAGSSTFSRPDLEPKQTSASTRNFASTSGGSGPAPSAKASGSVVSPQSAASFDPLVILSYNVWFNESVELQRRMAAIGAIIEEHSPDVIFFQEVTPNIYSIFRQARWWARGRYKCSLAPAEIDRQYFAMMVTRVPVKAFRHEPFRNSVMGRDLVTAKADVGDDLELTLATTHLESPTGRDQMFSEPRVAQARTALSRLSPERNVIFGGDMNWNDQRDGPVPLPDGWIDPWLELHRGQPGYTYDSVLNQMLLGTLKGRVDRFFCRLTDFNVRSVEMVGREPLPGVTYEKPGWGRNPKSKTLPVLPSDHFGLLLKVVRKGR